MEEQGGFETPAIELSGVGVNYKVPADRILSFKEYVLRRLRGRVVFRDIWAVRDVDLAVESGEVLGIVGRNGAGKSTLLKVVSRVLRPTTGRVVVRGMVAPLLELGAGFHPDLTGRENVFLNASILGLSRKEVERGFGEIESFSGLSGFMDAPIRTYSSGMLARLGFSVATFERPDVLVLDEILAVGDLDFQQKSLDRIGSFRRRGTTILLVTHNVDKLTEHCDRAMWIQEGRIVATGEPHEVADSYRESLVGSLG